MVVMAIPIFTGNDAGKSAGDSVADRTEYYTTAKNLLTSGADAMERLMTAYKVKLGRIQIALFISWTVCSICYVLIFLLIFHFELWIDHFIRSCLGNCWVGRLHLPRFEHVGGVRRLLGRKVSPERRQDHKAGKEVPASFGSRTSNS